MGYLITERLFRKLFKSNLVTIILETTWPKYWINCFHNLSNAKGSCLSPLAFVFIYIVSTGIYFHSIPASHPSRKFSDPDCLGNRPLYFFLDSGHASFREACMDLFWFRPARLAGKRILMDYVSIPDRWLNLVTITANIINLFGCLLAGYALLQFPFKSRHAPTRFRFILDAIISSGWS